MLERLFALKSHGTNVRTEALAGLTTFLTMAYITFVNPRVLSDAGMDFGAVFVATCLAAAVGSLIMGLFANYPIVLAPGMGTNAFFTYTVVLGSGHSWQVALGAVFLSGILFVALSVLPVREWLVNSIPRSLKMAISAGIGLFLGLIALRSAGIVTAHPATLLTLGHVFAPPSILFFLGFFLMVALDRRGVTGAVLIGILVVALTGIALGVSEWKGVMAAPPSPMPTLLELDITGALHVGFLTVVLSFFFVDLFDTAGTLVGVAHRAGLLDEDGKLPRLGRALFADSIATVLGALFGTSTTTSYVESTAGVKAGGRTGLTAVVAAALFVACLFFAPLAESVPGYATAPALLFVACIMAKALTEVDWEDPTEYAPAVVTALGMPLTFSIAHGIGLGFVTYAAGKTLSGQWRALSPAILVIVALFVIKFGLVGS